MGSKTRASLTPSNPPSPASSLSRIDRCHTLLGVLDWQPSWTQQTMVASRPGRQSILWLCIALQYERGSLEQAAHKYTLCSVQKKQSSVQCRESSIIHITVHSMAGWSLTVRVRTPTQCTNAPPLTWKMSSLSLCRYHRIISLSSSHWSHYIEALSCDDFITHQVEKGALNSEAGQFFCFFEALPAQWAGWALGQCQLGSCRFGTLALLAPPRLLSSRHWPTDPPPGDLSLLPFYFILHILQF